MGESIVYGLKMVLAVAVFVAFMAAITTVVALIVSASSSTALGEIIGVISVYLPFNPAAVFGALTTCIAALISFLIAKKIYTLMNNTYQST